jgi:L-arabinose isomerase
METQRKPRLGLVAVASRVESGGQRGEELIFSSKIALERAGLDVREPGFIVWSSEDAQKAVKFFLGEDVDMLLIIHCTWVIDSLQFQLVKGIKKPVMLWALPFQETFSLASVQHFSSILFRNQVPTHWVFGLPDEDTVISEIRECVGVAYAFSVCQPMNVGLVSARPTWRLAGAQDMVQDEWDLSNSLGIHTIHIEMDDWLAEIKSAPESDAKNVLEKMKSLNRYGTMKVEERRILHSAKVYLAAKSFLAKYQLAGLTVACYPYFGGLVNLASSWLADEGIILDPEGDVGHTMVEKILFELKPGMPIALAEMVAYDDKANEIFLRHEGSTAHSLAENPSCVEVIEAGDGEGTIVQFPMKKMDTATLVSMNGQEGYYRLYTGKFSVEGIADADWRARGGNFQVCLGSDEKVIEKIKCAFENGMDHHWLLKEGDYASAIEKLSKLWGLDCIVLG